MCGYDTREKFAAALALPGFGAGTIRSVEAGERALRPQELAFVADTLGLPRSFFKAPLAELGPAENPALPDELLARLDRIEQMLSEDDGDGPGAQQ